MVKYKVKRKNSCAQPPAAEHERTDSAKMKKTLLKILTRTSAYYTATAGLYSFVIFAMYSSEENGAILSAKRIFLLLPFCLCFAAANTALASKTLPRGLGYPLHCAATMLGVYLCVLLPAGMESRQRLVGFMTALVIYIAAMVVYALIAKHVKKTVTEEKNFRSQSADKAGKSKNENE